MPTNEPKKAPKNCFIPVSLCCKIRRKVHLSHQNSMNVAFLGMGGNLGDQRARLQSALAQLAERGCRIEKVSRYYHTAPWGSTSTNNYVNIAVQISCEMDAIALHGVTSSIEASEGRIRTEERNADRTMDIDILCFNSEVIRLPTLAIPHPRMHLRPFVLMPLSEIAPVFVHPELHRTFKELCDEVGTEGILAITEI